MRKFKWLIFSMIIFAILGVSLFLLKPQSTLLGYQAVDPTHFSVALLADQLTAPTRIKLTPDGQHLLVAEISGPVLVFDRMGQSWNQTPYKLTEVATHFPGFPPEEGGLTGLVFSSDFAKNGKLFLLYSFKDQQNQISNRISVVTLTTQKNRLVATLPEQIFVANVAGSDSHQITDGVGVKVMGKPHLLFAIGEAFNSTDAQNPRAESGKIMMIAEDGGNPVGARPYALDPKIQAIGLRNAYALAQNSSSILIADTGPDRFDRLINLRLYNPDGAKIKPINLGWHGSEADLEKPLPDPNSPGVKDVVLLRLPETLTFTGLAFHPGQGAIPQSTAATQSLLMTLYGKTGSISNSPGKAIWLGRLSGPAAAPQLTTQPIIVRNPHLVGQLGNPVGLEVDPQTGDFFFADIMEGKLYQVKVK